MSAPKEKKRIEELKRDARRYIIPHFADYELLTREPKIFVKGEGCYLWDIEGNKYLDTFASLLTTIIGHGRKEIAAVAEKQMRQLEFFPNYVDTFTPPLIAFLILASSTPEPPCKIKGIFIFFIISLSKSNFISSLVKAP